MCSQIVCYSIFSPCVPVIFLVMFLLGLTKLLTKWPLVMSVLFSALFQAIKDHWPESFEHASCCLVRTIYSILSLHLSNIVSQILSYPFHDLTVFTIKACIYVPISKHSLSEIQVTWSPGLLLQLYFGVSSTPKFTSFQLPCEAHFRKSAGSKSA